jgi:hypothetical protein
MQSDIQSLLVQCWLQRQETLLVNYSAKADLNVLTMGAFHRISFSSSNTCRMPFGFFFGPEQQFLLA